jgi:hypothetical protein
MLKFAVVVYRLPEWTAEIADLTRTSWAIVDAIDCTPLS